MTNNTEQTMERKELHIEDILNLLPDGYRELALKERAGPAGRNFGGFRMVVSMSSAIMNGFDWSSTEHGSKFWSAVHEWVLGISPLPPIPEPAPDPGDDLSGKKVSVTIDGKTYSATID